ncbi:adenosine deaminase CECR1, partial [Brachionus plicatilis]
MDEKIYPTDSKGRWLAANKYGVFGFYSDLTKYNRTRFDYLKACLDLSLEENVQLVEFRRSNFGGLYYLDNNLDKVYIQPEEELEMLTEFKKNYIRENPQLIDFVFVIYGSRSRSRSDINSTLETSLRLQSKFPQMIRGFDLVGEEDQGHTLLFHSDTLMRGFNYSQSSNGTFNLIFHTAETNWPEDMEPSKFGDAVSTLNNIYDSIILRTSRVGHGIGLIKHPELYQYLIERGIAIEACPASNQILGYVSDLRNHPAINFFRSGIPIVLAGDDPGSFGYNDLTVDYYLAYMAWGLDLYDLKIIANNSIKYSSIPHELKKIGYEKFEKEWVNFIDEAYQDVCLKRDSYSQVNVSNLLPTFGPASKQVELSIFGIGFEKAICQKIACLFNDIKTEAIMIGIGEIQ